MEHDMHKRENHFTSIRNRETKYISFNLLFLLGCQIGHVVHKLHSGRVCRLLCLCHCRIDAGHRVGTLLQKVFQKAVVQEFCAAGLGQHGPKQEGQLEGKIKGNPVQNESLEGFDQGKERKQNPVHGPLNIIPLILVFNSQNRLVRRVNKTNEGAQGIRTNSEKDQDDEKETSGDDQVFLGDLDLFLNLLECWDLIELDPEGCKLFFGEDLCVVDCSRCHFEYIFYEVTLRYDSID
mmetsp:Transcript_3805/g.7903  ORF Transcript_3805/g.7903 Transcript_3805/m.7903 type:complete len:236 (-) Transcript_3805:69-776(-)